MRGNRNTQRNTMRRENMQPPCIKTPGRDSNPGPSYCKETVQDTVSLCRKKNNSATSLKSQNSMLVMLSLYRSRIYEERFITVSLVVGPLYMASFWSKPE
ncbi:hypothetical protein ATANTOWER_001012 [Ataeniobius toweri]|uniref:Uncharacterized protein n=1 Tax=Ataeniobius toweri TaxID=208326 RepID=A0ABU7CC63_9TELE|nr:hypothetical protein [Ataeniobius toweri]